MRPYKRSSAVIGAVAAAAVLLLVYNHLLFLLVSNGAQTVKVAALLSARAGHSNNWHDASVAGSYQDPGVAQGLHQHLPSRNNLTGSPEIWAEGPQTGPHQQQLLKLLDAGTVTQLKSLCGRCLYRTLTSYVRSHDFGRLTVVLTGDIPAMWIRDSAVQMASYFPRVAKRPALRQTLEGAIRAQCYFLLQVRGIVLDSQSAQLSSMRFQGSR